MGFKRDLALGKKGENLVIKLFSKHGIEVESNPDKETRSHYDIVGKFEKKNFTIEVKYDYKAAETGNLAIEYSNPKSNKPSGINVTKATFWSTIVDDMGFPTIWLASVKSLKKFINEYKPWKIFSFAGDGNASIYLYKNDLILDKIFHRIDKLAEDEFKKILKRLIKEK